MTTKAGSTVLNAVLFQLETKHLLDSVYLFLDHNLSVLEWCLMNLCKMDVINNGFCVIQLWLAQANNKISRLFGLDAILVGPPVLLDMIIHHFSSATMAEMLVCDL